MNKLIFLLIPLFFSFLLAGCVKVEDAEKVSSTPIVQVEDTEKVSPTPIIQKEEKMDTNLNSPEIKTGNLTTDKKLVTITTSKGDIELELYPLAAPKTVDNFLKKAEAGFYNNLTWHRVEDWVIQGGDPSGNGTGGGDQSTELNDLTFSLGSIGIARGGDIRINNDSQFFIVKKDSAFLDKQYTNFGKVIIGMDVVDRIEIGDKILGIKGK